MSGAISEREAKVLSIIETARAKKARFRDKQITMAHGAGGKATQTLIEGLFVPAMGTGTLEQMADAGLVEIGGVKLAMTTDSFVIKPLRFPGGSIGELAVNGTVNDLAMAGAKPVGLTLSLILEEGLDQRGPARGGRGDRRRRPDRGRRDPRRRHQGRRAGTRRRNVHLHHGSRPASTPGQPFACRAAARRPDHRLGTIADHGTAIMLSRGEFELDAEIESDTRSLWPAAESLLDAAGAELRCMRDATRGGVASVLNELARASGVAIVVRERDVPINPTVAAAAELLGIDPMYVANEGKFVAFVAPEGVDAALAALRSVPGCEAAAEIGEVRREPPGMVLVETSFGGRRVMDQLVGDPLPRIC